jgi:hypothetical protein
MTKNYIEKNEDYGTATYWPDHETAERFGSFPRRKVGELRWYHEDIELHWMPTTGDFYIIDVYDNGNAYIRHADPEGVVHWFMMKHAQVTKDHAFFKDLIDNKRPAGDQLKSQEEQTMAQLCPAATELNGSNID